MMDIKYGYFKTNISTTDNVTVDIGFVPDVLELFQTDGFSTISLIQKYTWHNLLATLGTSGQFGTGMPGSSQALSVLGTSTGLSDTIMDMATLNSEISAVDDDSTYVMIPSPIAGIGEVPVIAHKHTDASVILYHRGDNSKVGHCVRIVGPGVSNPPGLIFEAISMDANSNTDNASDITWPTVAGESVLDSGITWLARTEKLVKGGTKGFQLGSGMLEGSTQQSEWWFKAIRADKVRDLGDAAVQTDLRI